MINLSMDTIRTCPYTALIVNTENTRHVHEFWEITYTVSGKLTNIVNERPITCDPFTQFLIMKPGDIHEIKPDNGVSSPYEGKFYHRDIYVTDEKMQSICKEIAPNLYEELSAQTEPVCITLRNNILECLEATLNLFNSFEQCSASTAALFPAIHTSIVAMLLGLYIENKVRHHKQFPKWIEDFFKKLNTEEFLTKSVTEIVDELSYSHSYICRSFKKYVGKTMMQCINEAKIRYSTILLMNKTISVLEVALRLNYKSQSAYITAFKSIYGTSPNKWRKENLAQKHFSAQEYWGDFVVLE